MSDEAHRAKRSLLIGSSKPLLLAAILAVTAPILSQAAQTQSDERSGEQIVQARCAKCHQTGVGGAPRIGDRDAWIPRIKQGLDAVVRSAIKGHGGMPPRGGMADLSDPELRSAVVYMFNKGAVPAK